VFPNFPAKKKQSLLDTFKNRTSNEQDYAISLIQENPQINISLLSKHIDQKKLAQDQHRPSPFSPPPQHHPNTTSNRPPAKFHPKNKKILLQLRETDIPTLKTLLGHQNTPDLTFSAYVSKHIIDATEIELYNDMNPFLGV
jgi:hypothetical protein